MDFLAELHKDREPLAITLQKHKGIRRILEGFYPDNAHFIYELLQNAEDTGAHRVWFELSEDRLIFIHDGARSFTEKDVSSITDIGESSKENDEGKIGKFGVGFKSVFVYTETPHIYSKTFNFRITNFVLPDEIPSYPNLGNKTRFVFPFDNPKKSPELAFADIQAGLDALSETTLLFLSNLGSVQWKVAGRTQGILSRLEHQGNLVEVRKTSGNAPAKSSFWLRFTSPVEGLPQQNTALGFELGFIKEKAQFDANSPVHKQLKIVPAIRGTVSVFFPAEKESSGLRFHIHAPFIPELSRASIKDTADNAPLFQQIAKLAAESLHLIRRLHLLTPEFLGTLPNPEDSLPTRYQCIQSAIVAEMKTKSLTPTHDKVFAPANQLIQAKGALKDFLSREDLGFLLDLKDPRPNWAVGAQQKNSHQDHFIESLGIRRWDVDSFIALLSDRTDEGSGRWIGNSFEQGPDRTFMKWLSSKADDWHQQMYALLYRELEEDDAFGSIAGANIVRLSNRSYGTGLKCFFPSNGVENDELMPRVARTVFSSGTKKTQQAESRKFLEGVGVREVGEAEEIERILKQRYTFEAEIPDDDTHLQDMNRFLDFSEEHPAQSRLFSDYYIFKRETDDWGTAADTYIDSPYRETLLSVYYKCLSEEKSPEALSTWYIGKDIPAGRQAKFAELVSVRTQLRIEQTSCDSNPERTQLHSALGNWSYSYGIDHDYTIPRLDLLLTQPSVDKARLIWKTMCSCPAGSSVLQAVFRKNSSHQAVVVDSLLVHKLREAAWVPQKDGSFVVPADASRSSLLAGFPFDEEYAWLKAIRFAEREQQFSDESRRQQEIAEASGFHSTVQLERARRFAGLPEEEQERILAEFEKRKTFELPANSPQHPTRRAEKVSAQAKDAPERLTEERQRSVSVGLSDIKSEAKEYLREQYTNREGQMICQICQAELPFQMADGNYYFEAVEFLENLPGRHYQNYLALCPNHAAMFQFANQSQELLRDMFKALEGLKLEVMLASREMTIYFTDTHHTDLLAVLKTSPIPVV